MADSPFIPIKVENMMNIYVQNTSSGNNAPQVPVNNSLQNTTMPYSYPVTAEQAVRNLRMNGYFADIQKTIDEENYISPDELHEIPQSMCLTLIKSSQKIKTTTKTVYTQNIFGYGGIDGEEHKKPVAKNKFSSVLFAEFIVSEASTVYVENGYTHDKQIYLKCVSMRGCFDILIPLNDFNNYKIKKHIDSRVKFQAFTNNFKTAEINRLMFNYIKNKLEQNKNVYLLIYKPGFKREKNGNWRFRTCLHKKKVI